jgi:hypothetical protein
MARISPDRIDPERVKALEFAAVETSMFDAAAALVVMMTPPLI